MSEILEHATRLFAERGYDGTTLQDIADAIGITRPGLYNYISSKEQLLAALVRDVTENTVHNVRAVRLRTDLSSVEKLRTVVRALVLQRGSTRAIPGPRSHRGRAARGSSRPAPQGAQGGPRRDADPHRGVSTGEFRPRDERLAALSVIGMCNWVAWWFHPGSSHPAEPVADQLAQNAVECSPTPRAPDRRPRPRTAPCRWSGRTSTTSSASSVHSPVTTRPRHGPAEAGSISPGLRTALRSAAP